MTSVSPQKRDTRNCSRRETRIDGDPGLKEIFLWSVKPRSERDYWSKIKNKGDTSRINIYFCVRLQNPQSWSSIENFPVLSWTLSVEVVVTVVLSIVKERGIKVHGPWWEWQEVQSEIYQENCFGYSVFRIREVNCPLFWFRVSPNFERMSVVHRSFFGSILGVDSGPRFENGR